MRDHALYAVVLTVICVAGIIVLAALHDPVPDVLTVIAGGGVGSSAALSIPRKEHPDATTLRSR